MKNRVKAAIKAEPHESAEAMKSAMSVMSSANNLTELFLLSGFASGESSGVTCGIVVTRKQKRKRRRLFFNTMFSRLLINKCIGSAFDL